MNVLIIKRTTKAAELPTMPTDVDMMTIHYEPGDGTRYPIVITRVPPEADYGGEWLVCFGVDWRHGRGRCAVLSGTHFPAYFMSEQFDCSDPTAIALSDVLQRVIGKS